MGVTLKFAPLVPVPKEVPPEAAVYQFMLFPVEVALRFEDVPRHILAGDAVTEEGTEGRAETFTVAVTALIHPLLFVTVYVITELPADTPVTTPDVEFTVATLVVALLHTPPGIDSVNDCVAPTHTVPAPEIIPIAGNGLTVTGVVADVAPQEPVIV